MLAWLVGHGITEGVDEAVHAACELGNLPILRWLHGHKLGYYALYAVHSATYHGHLDVVKYLDDVGIVDSAAGMMRIAAERGHLDIVEWLYGKFTHNNAVDLFPPIETGSFQDLLRWTKLQPMDISMC